ncbi:MAG: hypothetical protein A2283_01170 [Lentisphaerae bacterium RIFOXYA12_FULL_48_11]|nr:MAG: hypothetical protein A2283_01170 [Lentisphaerae bacterium RIFOXYA12_FULL_48_11]
MSLNNYDVVLVSPPSRMVNHYRAPIALMYIAGYLRHEGLKVKIIDIPMRETVRSRNFYLHIQDVLRDIEERMINEYTEVSSSPIVGITCYSTELLEVTNLANRFKAINPNVKIVVGGAHPTLYPESIFEEPGRPIDFAVIGDGEITMCDLSKKILSSQSDYAQVDGIAFYDDISGRMIQTRPRNIVHDLDSISFPAYDLVDMQYYSTASPYAIKGVLLRAAHIMGGRGCPSQCTFCVAKYVRKASGGAKYLRMRTAESLFLEVKLLKEKYEVDAFLFLDDLFTLDKKNTIDFCNLILRDNIKMPWSCISKVSTLDEEMIKKMAEAGCIQIEFGVERGSNRALKLIKKGITIEEIINVFDICHKYGIRTYANMLVNLPQEQEQDLEDILQLLKRLKSEIVAINTFVPYPGTEIYNNWDRKFTREEYGLLSFANPGSDGMIKSLRFAQHNIDLSVWVHKHWRTQNKVWPHIRFYVSPKYWRTICHSQRKLDYLRGVGLLVREFINNKF